MWALINLNVGRWKSLSRPRSAWAEFEMDHILNGPFLLFRERRLGAGFAEKADFVTDSPLLGMLGENDLQRCQYVYLLLRFTVTLFSIFLTKVTMSCLFVWLPSCLAASLTTLT